MEKPCTFWGLRSRQRERSMCVKGRAGMVRTGGSRAVKIGRTRRGKGCELREQGQQKVASPMWPQQLQLKWHCVEQREGEGLFGGWTLKPQKADGELAGSALVPFERFSLSALWHLIIKAQILIPDKRGTNARRATRSYRISIDSRLVNTVRRSRLASNYPCAQRTGHRID